MSQEQLRAVKAALDAGPLDLSDPAPVARQNFEQMLSAIPPPEGVEITPVEAGGVPALWSDARGAAGDRVLLYLHGGGYVIGEPMGYRPLWSALARAAGARGLGLDYRLAPEHPFPAAVEDAVAAYRWLLDQGFAPGRIVIGGDSAGGGLTVATLVKARSLGLPMPAGALLISPWTDLACVGASISAKAEEDVSLDLAGLQNCARQYLGSTPASEPLASPIHADLSGLPPLLIQVGSAEILLDDSNRLATVAGAAGVRVRLEVWPHMPHVWHAFGFMLDEGAQAIAEAGSFLRNRLDGRP
jgi:acetyl esterase/lipase